MSPAIHLNGHFHHNGRQLFSDLALTLVGGKWTCLLGSSGVGKSTVLKLLADLPTGGEFQGDISADDGGAVAQRTAYMAQSDLLFPWLNVRDNIVLGSALRSEIEDAARAEKLIEQVGLRDHRDKRPHELSGGMRQRVALARTLMEDTPIVLLDEPFSALDTRTRREMQDLAFEMLQGKTVLLVTHDSAEALRLADQLLLMTTQGLQQHEIDAGEPMRALNDARCIDSQSRLLLALNQADTETPLSSNKEKVTSPSPSGRRLQG